MAASMPTVSEKLRSAAAAMRGMWDAKSAASYLESDVLRDVVRLNLPIRERLQTLIIDLRPVAASSFGRVPVAQAVVACLEMAGDCEGHETVTMTRAELAKRLDAEYWRGRTDSDGKHTAKADAAAGKRPDVSSLAVISDIANKQRPAVDRGQ